MAKGTVVYVDGTKVGLNTDGKKDGDKLVADKVIQVPKSCPVKIDGADGFRVADIKNGDTIRASESSEGGCVSVIVENRAATTAAAPKAKPGKIEGFK